VDPTIPRPTERRPDLDQQIDQELKRRDCTSVALPQQSIEVHPDRLIAAPVTVVAHVH